METMAPRARRARVVEGSCWQCKTRRVKCDLSRPTCGRCQRDGQQQAEECRYGGTPFKWVGGMALRGRNAPLARVGDQLLGPARPSPPRSSTDTSSSHSPDCPRRASTGSHTPPCPALTPRIDRSALVPYFVDVVLPRYCLGDVVLSLDHHILLQNEALQEAMLAMARAHFDLHAKHGSALARNRTRQTAITAFRKQLVSSACGDDAARDLFCTNVLFCLLDGMIEPTEETNASTLHLKGGFAILDRWRHIVPEMIAEGGIRTHLLSVFATIDLVHATLSGCKPHFDLTIYRQLANNDAWWGRVEADNAIIAASENLSRVASLGSLVRCTLAAAGLEATRKRIPYFEAMLSGALRAHLGQSACCRESRDTELDDWTAFCTLFDISGRIFYERAIKLKAVDDVVVQQYTREAVQMLAQDLFSGMLQHCIVLPLVIVGAHCLSKDQQDVISHAVSPTLSYLAFGCLPVMSDFLKTTWERRDLEATWWETFADIAEKIFLF